MDRQALLLPWSDRFIILSHMADNAVSLDDTFLALADPTRRAILSRLGQGPASVGELAAPFDMALTSFMKHLKVLERAGWITSAKSGRVRTCAIVTDRFADVGAWVYSHRALFEP
ncbi:transcriptional regulator, ArsR family [Caulobacter vibrioides OR37]|jgi:DNA-binding transcriptional ArsR family regulator|uniref:Transcriptional regulator, ArsR family n=2 Tax=Caulobacteraceae TaxID=76892 RepID=R0D4Z0_CAUVI|nr:transcriptional regulator, ArsR family [Caulobacter vibrioides OR37]